MRYLVRGATGQLGTELCPQRKGEVVAASRAELDLTRAAAIGPYLDAVRPDIAINCAAYNFVDRAESEPEAVFAVNSWGVRTLAAACGQRELMLVHFSSDYVFGLDDSRGIPYTETDAPGPLGVYGLSKLAGEYLVRALCPRHLIIRTCGLYGASGHGGKGGNFVETMLRHGAQGKTLRVVNDQVCTPTSTADLAEAAVHLIGLNQTGLFHVTNAGSTSWYDFAREIFKLAGMEVDVHPISSQEYGAAARRPRYSALALDRYCSLGLPKPRPWQEALKMYVALRSS